MQNRCNDVIERGLEIWQPRTDRTLTPEDIRVIKENLVGFFDLLKSWETAEANGSEVAA